jgi:deoxyribodipyrimidine photo-lyase
MADHAGRLARSEALYYPYVEAAPGAGRGLLAALASRACVVVTDDSPVFFLPRMVAAAARLPVALEKVDANGLLPLAAAAQEFVTAYQFRRFLQRTLPAHLGEMPAAHPLTRLPPRLRALPAAVLARWPAAEPAQQGLLARLPIDHAVPPVVAVRGGDKAASKMLASFAGALLVRYAEARGAPENDATSRLSPYLHWGSVSIHQVFAAVAAAERWTPDRLGTGASGGREGWWGMSAAAEKFLDQAVTWRELGYNMAARRPDAERYESLPAWAQATLARHAADARPQVYGLAELERGATHDELWNAAQRQLVREGRIHNYLRMLWGKKVLEWSPSPPEALAALVELNNKYALDGRDPNSYSGIFWCFGRYDRPWAPERPVFGTVRYMSSQNTRRKMDVDGYIARYGPQRGEQAAPLRGAGR